MVASREPFKDVGEAPEARIEIAAEIPLHRLARRCVVDP
jgi:hypothetical protein